MSPLFAALDATWPAARAWARGPFTLRDGAGGGKRVSAAILDGAFDDAALDAAIAEMEQPLFQVRPGQEGFDAALDRRGFRVIDATILMQAPVAALAQPPVPVSLLGCWPPMAIQRQIWAAGGIGPQRVAVMLRAQGPRQAFVARYRNRAAGAAYLGLHDGIAMVHALEVERAFRRQGVARWMMTGMAHWAQEQGAHTLALAVTRANTAARALYTGLGMTDAAAYHYRELPT